MPLRQKPVPALPPSLDLTGKTALVTGANRGLGFTTCQQYIEHGISKLILAVRSKESGETARLTLIQEAASRTRTSQPLEIVVRELDMESMNSVVALVDGLVAENVQVHMAVLNAGIRRFKWTIAAETGNESVFQVNYLSTAMLALLLLPILTRTSEATGTRTFLTVVGSELQASSPWNKKTIAPSSVFGAFNDEASFTGFARYPDTKYLIFQFVHRLAREVDRAKVNVLVVGPGMVSTGFGKEDMALWMLGPAKLLQIAYARTPAQGARVITYASSGLAGDAAHGELVANMAVDQ